MDCDRGHTDKGSSRVAILESSVEIRSVNYHATHQASGTDSEGGSSLTDSAVSSSDDGARVEERSTAEVGSAALQTDDEGEVTSSSNRSTDDGDRVLGSGSSKYCGGHEASNHCFVLHGDEVLGSEVVSVGR